jgi:hypothetical protein
VGDVSDWHGNTARHPGEWARSLTRAVQRSSTTRFDRRRTRVRDTTKGGNLSERLMLTTPSMLVSTIAWT